jgi:multicomponent Na+:H+ antiporter subunit D
MDVLVPLPVAIPLLAAAFLTAFGHFMPRRLDDLIGLAAAAATATISLLLLFNSSGHDLVYWFGGWHPRGGVAIGIAFTIDPFGAGVASLVGVLVTAALAFSWRYFDEVGTLFHVLMLVFLGAMIGFALSGDLFNMFVWFELMSVAAYALTGYRVEEASPLEGAINFAVTNSVGSFCILFGTGLLYARTGALNLAQIGHALAGHNADGLVVAAFALLIGGLLVKAAVVPFHFWLADAHAVAPTPVCVLFSGIMVELGIYGVARVYWTVFAGVPDTHGPGFRAVLLGFGTAGALVGGTMCFLQRHLKRLLAYSTISHAGIFLIGVALLSAKGLAGSAAYVLSHGLLKGALFLCVGILLNKLSSVDELVLQGRGRDLPMTGAVFALSALAIAGPPPFGTFLGKSLIDEGATALDYHWIPLVVTVASILTSGAMLRAAGRVFLGLGASSEPYLSEEPDEQHEVEHEPGRSQYLMLVPPTALAVAGIGISLVPGLERHTETSASRFRDTPAYVDAVLNGHQAHHAVLNLDLLTLTTPSVLWGIASALGAVLLAAVALNRERLRPRFVKASLHVLNRALDPIRALHSGAVGDYVTWLVVGMTVLGGLFAVVVR